MKNSEVRVYVISLSGHNERREFISKQLDQIGISYSFFDAINVSTNLDYCKYIDLHKSIQVNGRKLSNGEIGCSLSHYFVYKDIVEKKINFALILEDDAIVDDNLKFFVEGSILNATEWDVILLGYSKVSKQDYVKINKFNPIGNIIYNRETKIGRVLKNTTCGTVGYLVSFSGASKLLAMNLPGNTLADNWPYFEKHGGLSIFHCRPFLVFEDFLNLKSSIEHERPVNDRIKTSSNYIYDLLKYVRGYLRSFILFFK